MKSLSPRSTTWRGMSLASRRFENELLFQSDGVTCSIEFRGRLCDTCSTSWPKLAVHCWTRIVSRSTDTWKGRLGEHQRNPHWCTEKQLGNLADYTKINRCGITMLRVNKNRGRLGLHANQSEYVVKCTKILVLILDSKVSTVPRKYFKNILYCIKLYGNITKWNC